MIKKFPKRVQKRKKKIESLTPKSIHRFWGLTARLEHERIKGNQKRK